MVESPLRRGKNAVSRKNHLAQRGSHMIVPAIAARYIPANWQLPLDLTPLPEQGGRGGLWIDPVALLACINAPALAS